MARVGGTRTSQVHNRQRDLPTVNLAVIHPTKVRPPATSPTTAFFRTPISYALCIRSRNHVLFREPTRRNSGAALGSDDVVSGRFKVSLCCVDRTNEFDKEYGNCIDPSILQELEDLPRATSAPPHLQNRHGAASADILNRTSTTARVQGVENYNEVRYGDDYDAYYSLQGEPDNLQPPSDGHALYSDLQGYLPQYKDPSFMTGAFTRFGSGGGVFGMPSGGGSGAFSSQPSLNRAALETVEEQPTGKKEDSVLQTLNQLHIGNDIQRPGSQPAPNLLQALAAEAGHYRSASALASFNLEGFSGLPGNGGPPPPPDSNPAPNESSGFNPMLQRSRSNDYLTQMQGPGSMLAGSLEYQAAYQAALQTALLQSQNNPQMMLGPQMSPTAQTNHHHGGLQTHANYNGGIQTHGMNNEMSILAAKMHQQQSPVHGGYSQTNSSNPAPTTGGFQSTKDLPYPKEDRGGRGKRYGRRDRERVTDPAFNNDPYYDNQYLKFNAIEEVVGQVIQVAQDQNGCRFLQRKFDEGGSQAISKVFSEIISSIIPLMKDPFGNYLIQKLLDRCSESQRTEVVKAVAEGGELISIALSTHGTRAVQKLIETLTTEEQRKYAIAALKPGVVDLIKDLNGNHVVQRCLQRLGPEDSQFIYDAAIGCCVEIASHRHGCCVLQRCIDFATPEQRHNLVMEISNNALVLSQDAFGNYVVQYVLDLGQPEASQSVMNVLMGHYSDLAVQKFSSNVVEKCLKLGGLDDARESIIKEIMHSPALARLLQDPYGNYVVQSALSVTSGSLHQSLVDCIRPYLPTLKGNPHGKRILQKVLASLKDPF